MNFDITSSIDRITLEGSWSSPELPTIGVSSVDCRLAVSTKTPITSTLPRRKARLKTRRARIAFANPKVISVPLGRNMKITVRSFPFATAAPRPNWLTSGEHIPRSRSVPTARSDASDSTTRLVPPADVVKLVDRLFYVLQPPLESWVAGEKLHLPHQPFPYQYEGIAFLYPRHAAILADEMGLGKTMQAITAIRFLLHSGELQRVLLVCPKPLVSNWEREFAQWAPEVPVMSIVGPRHRRVWQWRLPEVPVRIANYELLHRDQELLLEPGQKFDLVVLDESQRIKNRASNISSIVRHLRRSRSWALTGTPVENSADDLVGIFEFVSPGTLHDQMKLRQMGRLAGDYVLRRTKNQVLNDLPPCLVQDTPIDLLPEQQESYRMAEEEGVLRLTKMGDAATIHHVFELVLRLKQICNFDPATGHSAKLERLEADLEEIAASGQKAIVFSQWVASLVELRRRLKRFGPLEYHGRIPTRQRDDVIRRFREDPDAHLLLISYGAGCVGLNLQFASYVFLFDRWWNPAVEDQAINRAHRIGSSRAVNVARFISLSTIEERIDQVLRDKREIFATIFSDVAPQQKMGLSRKEIFGLFDLQIAQDAAA